MLRHLAVAAALSLAALATGCGSIGATADNVPQSAVDEDYSQCQSRAFVSTALVKTASEAEDRQQEIIDECMKEKGYNAK